MIKTLNYPNPAKTAEIMSRYRPIAPKPETNSSSNSIPEECSNNNNTLPQKIKQSPYLRYLWPQLQARPTKTRKRGRASMPVALPPSSLIKRHKACTTTTHILGFCSPCHVTSPATKNLISLQTFAPLPNDGLGVLNCQLEKTNIISTTMTTTTNPSLVTLPLLPCSPSSAPPICPPPKVDLTNKPCKEATIDLNLNTNIPEEMDLLQQLQIRPATTTTTKNNNNVIIAPQPVRPIGSCISVGCISTEDPTLTTTITTTSAPQVQPPKRKEEVEEEVESEALPAVISDSNNRVRMANSAYKELVGLPECPWLESIVTGCRNGRVQCSSSCRRRSERISGEVTLQLCDSINIPVSSNGFSCWVRIEWQSSEDQRKKSSVNAFCDVIRLSCEFRDYLFTWRFHTRTREASQSSSNV